MVAVVLQELTKLESEIQEVRQQLDRLEHQQQEVQEAAASASQRISQAAGQLATLRSQLEKQLTSISVIYFAQLMYASCLMWP